MTRRQALALAATAAIGVPATAQSIPLSRSLIPSRTGLSRLGLEKHWTSIVPLANSAEHVTTINLADTMLFAQTDAGNLYAYDAESGRFLWSVDLGNRSLDNRPVAVNSDLAFAANGRELHAIHRRTGRVVWTKTMDGTAVGTPVATEERVMLGMASGSLEAYNARDHTRDNPPGRSAGTFAWAFRTFGPLTSRPVPTDKVTAFASQDGRLYVAQDNPPTVLFRYLTAGPISAGLATHGTRTLLVSSEDGTVYAVDLYNGETKWSLPTGAALKQRPLVAGDVAYSMNTVGSLTAINVLTGLPNWSLATQGGTLMALGGSRIYISTFDKDLMIVDRVSGRLVAGPRETRDRAGVSLRDYDLIYTNFDNDRMYFATKGGFLLSLREAGFATPRSFRDPKAKPFGYLPPQGEPPVTPPPAEDQPPAEGGDPPK